LASSFSDDLDGVLQALNYEISEHIDVVFDRVKKSVTVADTPKDLKPSLTLKRLILTSTKIDDG